MNPLARPLVSALLLAAALWLTLVYTVRAHGEQPSAPPGLPACRTPEPVCAPETRVFPGLHNHPVTATWPLTLYPDGKGWLQTIPTLTAAIANGEIEQKALFDQPCVNGFVDVFPCDHVDLLAYLPPPLIGGQTNNDQWGWTDPQSGVEYALIGARDGSVILDLSTPTAPRYVGKLPTHTGASIWRDLQTYRDHLFVVADYNRNHGMQIYDLAGLRTITTGPVALQASGHYSGFNRAHNLAIDETSGFAYAVGSETCAGGLHIIDLRDLTNPQGLGCYREDGYIHDAQCLTYQGGDESYRGRELCFNSSVSKLTIVDVTDKHNPVRVSALHIPGTVYIHQSWLTADQSYLLFDDEMDETFNAVNTRTYIVDVRQIDTPRLVDIYTTTLTAIDHNLYISGTYAYQANYTTGLRVLDIQDIDQGQLREVAAFDTVPENNAAVFDGAWTAYPYYRDGKVVITTLDRGVFVVQPRLQPDVIFARGAQSANFCRINAEQAEGEPSTATLDLLARNQYTQPTQLSLREAPEQLTATFSPATLDWSQTAAATSTISVDLGTLPTGNYTTTVGVADGEGEQLDTLTFSFHVAAGPTVAPELEGNELAPAGLTNIRLAWQPLADAVSYTVEVADDPGFTELHYRKRSTTPALTLAAKSQTALRYGQTYYWRVQGVNGCGGGAFSATGIIQMPTATYLPLINR